MINSFVIVITGGAGFLGRHLCDAIASHNGIVIVADVDFAAASHIADEICKKHPNKAEATKLDITDKKAICKLIDSLHQKYGRIDAIVNNAYPRNSNYGRKLEDVAYSDFCQNINLHLGGYFLTSQQFALYFKKQKKGNIINISSIYGVIAPRFEIYDETEMTMPVEYAAIKSAVVHITKYFAQYYKKSGIRVNCISPGGIFDSQPKPFLESYKSYSGNKGMLDPTDICGSLIFLLSDASNHITGQNIIIDDGFTL